MAKSSYKFGRKGEDKVARSLRSKKAKVATSIGSRGAADLVAKFPSGTTWKIQVKASRTGKAHAPSSKDIGRLKQAATKSHSTAVIANVTTKGIEYKSARSGKKLKPPSIKKKK
jgi:Holliday junction resolvase-like predicted endonuclease